MPKESIREVSEANKQLHQVVSEVIIMGNEAVWVEFHIWGQHSATFFDSEEEALEWCKTINEQGFAWVIGMYRGTESQIVLYDEEELHALIRE